MINRNVNNIVAHLSKYLQNWGVNEADIKVDSRKSKLFMQETIDGVKDGYHFRVILYVKAILDENTHGGPSTFFTNNTNLFQFDLSLVFFLKNPHGINLSIEQETFGDKVNKLFGKRDLEVYDEAFDKAYLIKSDHSYAYVDILSQNIRDRITTHGKPFTKYVVRGEQVRYKTNFVPNTIKVYQNKLHNLLEIGLELSKNVESWEPPKA